MLDRRSASRGCWPGRSPLSQSAEFLQVNILVEAQIQLQAAEDEKKKALQKEQLGLVSFPHSKVHPMTFWGPVSLAALGQPRLWEDQSQECWDTTSIPEIHPPFTAQFHCLIFMDYWISSRIACSTSWHRQASQWNGPRSRRRTMMTLSWVKNFARYWTEKIRKGMSQPWASTDQEPLGCLIWRYHFSSKWSFPGPPYQSQFISPPLALPSYTRMVPTENDQHSGSREASDTDLGQISPGQEQEYCYQWGRAWPLEPAILM